MGSGRELRSGFVDAIHGREARRARPAHQPSRPVRAGQSVAATCAAIQWSAVESIEAPASTGACTSAESDVDRMRCDHETGSGHDEHLREGALVICQ